MKEKIGEQNSSLQSDKDRFQPKELNTFYVFVTVATPESG